MRGVPPPMFSRPQGFDHPAMPTVPMGTGRERWSRMWACVFASGRMIEMGSPE